MQNSLKDRIKEIAKSKGKSLKDIYQHLGISQVAFDKSFLSKNFIYSKKIHDIATFLSCTVDEIILLKQQPDVNDQVNENVKNYTASKNNIQDNKTELYVLRNENELLKIMNAKQEKEIEFLRSLLMK